VFFENYKNIENFPNPAEALLSCGKSFLKEPAGRILQVLSFEPF